MAYTPPSWNVVPFDWSGESTHIPPAGGLVAFAFGGAVFPSVDIAATLPVTAAQSVAHGTSLAGVASIPITAAMSLDYTSVDIDIALAASIPIGAAAEVAHGVSLSGIATIPVSAELSTVHGVSVAASAVIGVTALQNVVHGVALDGIAIIALTADADVQVERYEVRGEVRLSGVLANRRVRAYQRSSGAMLGEADTVIGKFKVHTGFAPVECYITPIDLAADATDWLPPTANRVTSVLAMDTA